MFEKPFHNDLSPERQELRDFFADRLRLAFDFATLGAYELTGADADPEAAGAEPRPADRHGRNACTSGPRRRHVVAASVSCPAPADARRSSASCARGGRRGGSVPTPEQPCVCAG
jgi:hypothetical protein